MDYDLLIKNGQTVGGIPVEIVIEEKKMAVVVAAIPGSVKETIHLEPGTYISTDWIDDHAHCFERMTLYYDYPDEIGVKKGVTTMIDAETTGAENIHELYNLAQQAKADVSGLVNISKWGVVTQDELAGLGKVQASLVKKAIQELPDSVVGIRARVSRTVIGDNGITPLELAKQIQQENQEVPLMVHIGSAPSHLDGILTLMEKGDVLTHCFNGKENDILDQATDRIKNLAWRVYSKGVALDIGHGTDSSNLRVAETALREGTKVASASTDIYIHNRENGPIHDLTTTMEELRVVGYDRSETIGKATKAPVENFHSARKGTLETGKDANLTIFTIQIRGKALTDSNGLIRVVRGQIRPIRIIIRGQIYNN